MYRFVLINLTGQEKEKFPVCRGFQFIGAQFQGVVAQKSSSLYCFWFKGVRFIEQTCTYCFTTLPHPHGHWQLQEPLGNQAVANLAIAKAPDNDWIFLAIFPFHNPFHNSITSETNQITQPLLHSLLPDVPERLPRGVCHTNWNSDFVLQV